MGLTCDGLGQERLARSRRANEQRTLRDLAAQFGVFLGILEELHDLLDLLFGLHQSGHVFEGHLQVIAQVVARLRAFRPATAAAAAEEGVHDVIHAEAAHAAPAAETSKTAKATETARTACTAARHASHEEEPEQDDDDKGPHGSEDVPKDVVALLVGHLGGDMLLGHHLGVEVGELVG